MSQQLHCGFLNRVARIGAAMAGSGRATSAAIAPRQKVRLFISILLTVSDMSSCDAEDGHQSGHLVIRDMAMQHPVSGIVGDEGDIDDLSRPQQHGVGPLSMWNRRAVAAQHPEAVAVEMHRMPERCLITNGQRVASSELK